MTELSQTPSLEDLQGWLQCVINTRGDLREKLCRANHGYQLNHNDIIADKRQIPAYKRLEIYTTGYVLRLLECMRADYPALISYWGEPMFDTFARAFIVTLPPQSYTLFEMSQRFPKFLKDTKPPDEVVPASQRALLDLPADIAELERTQLTVLRAKGLEKAPPAPITSEFDLLNYALQIKAAPCLELLTLRFAVIGYLAELANGETPEPPPPKTTSIAISRVQYQLRAIELTQWQYHFLTISNDITSVNNAVQYASQHSEVSTSQILAELFIWLPIAFEAGFIRRIN